MWYVLLALCSVICVTDLHHRKIYNHSVIALFALSLCLSSQDLTSISISIAICFSIGFIFLAVHIWGGGDSKLLIALAPLIPPGQLVDFFVAILICGGGLSLFYLIKYRLIYTDRKDIGLPYGVALILGAVLTLYSMPELPVVL